MNAFETDKRLYLDNAATSWPKPEAVYAAVNRYQRELGVAAGRGSYRAGEEVDRTITQLRRNILKLIGAAKAAPEQCVFTQNCTESLNLALHGLLRPGDHVVTSEIEHNSIARPLKHLEVHGVTTSVVSVNDAGLVDLDELREKLSQKKTRLLALTHASNVTGAVQPIAEVGELARECGSLLLIDAAQTLGHVPLSVEELQIDLLAAPGHKGLLGPLGTGFLYIRTGLEEELAERCQGGTGTSSELLEQPQFLPSKYEAGNANVPGLYGLNAGVQHVIDEGLGSANLRQLTEQTIDALKALSGIEIYSPANACGIVSFNVDGFDPREVAGMLDSSGQIEVRAGLHCAPGTHKRLGTFEKGGCARASFGHFSEECHVTQLVEALKMLADFS